MNQDPDPLQQQPFPPQQQWPQAPMTPMQSVQQPPKKRRVGRNVGIGCGILFALVIVIVIIAGASSNESLSSQADQQATASNNAAVAAGETAISNDQLTQAATQATSQPTSAPTQTASKPTPVATQRPAPAFITFGDGSYQVGTDVKPGTYRTQTGSPNCYYERLKGFSGNTSDILANNNTDNPAIVTIFSTDKGFTSQNCGTWTSDLSQITPSTTSFSDGMYLVGVDITPGTYKNTASPNCYYARLTGFSNSTDDIIANNNTDTAAIVTIFASDKGFESTNCGIWTKI